MDKLSKKEWVAVAVAIIFVGYTLFGGDIMSLFQNKSMNQDSQATAVNTDVSTSTENATQNTSNSVLIKDVTIGKGAEVKTGQLVTVNYILALSDGKVIQNSKYSGKPFQFTLGAGQVIHGWEQGFAGMKVGGVRIITIPPALGYGSQAQGPIPANSTLVFTIELLDAKAAPTAQPAK